MGLILVVAMATNEQVSGELNYSCKMCVYGRMIALKLGRPICGNMSNFRVTRYLKVLILHFRTIGSLQ